MHQPSNEHWEHVKRVLRYLYGTLDEGILIHRDSPITLHAVSDADWAGNKDDYSSTSAYIVYLDLGIKLPAAPIIYCDNVGATQLCSNPIFHSRMKHVAIDFHFIRDQVQTGSLRVAHVSSKDQLADALTKSLPHSNFQTIKHKIGLSCRGLS
ncbi:hypothetical protein LWI29_031347 [Acer saccharum]|uniref:Uncharacterized protein n=1 Tax=Acer saccharum TaxID=4024 RepID=A0AA39W5R0_ACESA|nr:hypothetical protein LWI29_031347 [Acer saccharum]